MTGLASIRKRQRSIRLAHLREGMAPLVRACPGASVLLFGSMARGDWDGFSTGPRSAETPSLRPRADF